MQIARMSLFDKICIAGGPGFYASPKNIYNKICIAGELGVMQIAKISMTKYKLLKSSNANCKNISI